MTTQARISRKKELRDAILRVAEVTEQNARQLREFADLVKDADPDELAESRYLVGNVVDKMMSLLNTSVVAPIRGAIYQAQAVTGRDD